MTASTISSRRVPPFAGREARNQTSASTTTPIGNPIQSGASFQRPESRMSVVMKMPDAIEVTAP